MQKVAERGIYVIVDKVTDDITGPVISARNDAEAMRLMLEMLGNDKTSIGIHPRDHQLFKCGQFILNNDEGRHTVELKQDAQLILDGSTWADLNRKDKDNG